MDLWRISPGTGIPAIVGVGKVSADGALIDTLSGGVMGAGWYYYVPTPVAQQSPDDNAYNPISTLDIAPVTVPINSEANLYSGEVTDTYQLQGYQSLGVNQSIQLSYSSTRANPKKLINFEYKAFAGSRNNGLLAELVLKNGDFDVVSAKNQWELNTPPTATPVQSALQIDTSGLESGIYQYDLVTGLNSRGAFDFIQSQNHTRGAFVHVQNIVNPFGSGWGLAGLQQIVVTDRYFTSESLLLIDGNGTEQVFTVIKRDSNGDTEYGSASGNPSTFKRFAPANIVDGILFERRLTDGTVYKFDTQNRIKTVSDRHRNTTTYEYDPNGIISSITDAAGLITTFHLNGNRIDKIIDPAGRETKLNYDANGDLRSIKDPDTTENKWEYDANHLMEKSIDKLNNVGIDEYDDLGRVNKAIKKDGSVVEFFNTYTPALGQILTGNTQNNNTQTDTIGMLFPDPTIRTPQLKSIDGNGNLTTLYFNRFGQVIKSQDDLGIKENTYNSRGSLTQTSEWLNGVKHSTSYAYNENNQVTEIAYGDKLSSLPLAQYSNTSDRVSTAANVNHIGYFKDIIETTSAGVTTSIVNQFVVTSDKTGQIITKRINQDGLFATDGTQSFSLRNQLRINTVDRITVKKILTGDFNHDGKQDLAIGYDQEVLNSRTNDFFYITNSLSYTNSARIAILNGDGLGRFQLDSTTVINPNTLFDNYQFEIADLAAGDFNHDGKLDIVAANFIEPYAANWSGGNNYHLYMLVNDGHGKLSSAGANSGDNRQLKPFTSVDIKGILTTAKDVSGKDLLIVASPNAESTKITAYESDNNGKLTPILDKTVLEIARDIKAADIDGDGAGEIIVNGSQLHTIKISSGELYTSAYTTQNTGFWSYMAVGDVDKDGRPDILVANDNSTLKVFLGKYDSVSAITKYDTAPQIYQGTASPRGLIIADLNSNASTNNDYLPDVIIGDAFAGLDIKLHIPASSNTNVVHQTFEYDARFGQLTKSIDEEGRITLYDIDSSNGDIRSITKKGDANTPDSVTNFSYTNNPWGLVSTITDAEGKVTENIYDPTYGYLTEVKQGGTTVSKFIYNSDNSGNVQKKIDGNGKVTQYSYKKDSNQKDTNRIETETYDPSLGSNQKTNYDYDEKGQLISAINSDGYGQKFKYDALGRVNITTNFTAKGTTIQQTIYDRAGNLIDIQNINNATYNSITGLYTNNVDGANIHNVYDARNRLTEIHNVDGSTTKYKYDALNNLTQVIDAEGYETNYVYTSTNSDSRMRQIETRKQIKHNSYLDELVTKTDYNNALQVTEVTDGRDKKTKYKYDGLGRQIQVTQELDIALADSAVANSLANSAMEIVNKTTYYDNGNIKTITDGNNRTTTYTYDARNLKSTSTDALGNVTTYTYDDAGNVTGMSTVNPNIQGTASISYGYDALNRRTHIIDAQGETTTTSYDLSGNITRMEDANHQATQYQYQPANRTITTIDALGHQIAAIYDRLGRISIITQQGDLSTTEDDRVTASTYDLINNTTIVTRPEGVVEVTKLDSVGNVKSVTTTVNGENRTTAYQYNGLKQITLLTDTLNNTQAFEYDELGNRTFSIAKDYLTGEIHTTQYQTNNLGWTTQTTDAEGRVFKNSYDAVGNVIEQNENNLRTTTSKYDQLNRLLQVTTANGAEILNTFTSYDAVGNILKSKDANGNITQYQYNTLNRRIKVIDAKLQDTDYTYDAVGNLTEVIDTPTRKIFYTYDELNRRTDVKDAENIVTHTEYTSFGEVKSITENYNLAGIDTRTTQFKYDKLGRKVKSIDPFNKATITTYDEANNVRSVTDANQNTISYDYDRLNRQTKAIDANGITTQLTTYDGFGNVKSIKDAGGNRTSYEYDLLDRLTKTIDPRTKETIQSYDGLGRVSRIKDRNQHTRTFAYNINDNLLTESWGDGTTINYTYDKVGNLQTSHDGQSGVNNSYDYDAIYQLTDVGTSSSDVKFHYRYDEFGDLIQRQDLVNGLAIASLNYIYNQNHQLTGLIQSGAGLVTQTVGFGYDKLSQLTQVDRQSGGNSGHLITDYQYDAVGRLSDLNHRFNTTVISHDVYTYDDGNRLTGKSGSDGVSTVGYGRDNQVSTVDNSSRADEAYSFNALGIRAGWVTDALDSRRVLSDGKYQYEYDDEGNLTRKTEILTGSVTNYEWDYRNRLVRVTGGAQVVEYGYDAEDKRVSKKINGVVKEKYVYDGDDIALVVDGAGVLVERYLYGDGVDNVLSREKSGAVVWSLSERQGSVVDLVDGNGAVLNHFVYDSFGNRTGSSTAEFRYGYTGRELDGETGLYYYRARYYDPANGRFISEDPIGFGGGDTNLYRYVGNSPTNYTDPTGTTISGWADDALNAFDSFNAGFWNAATFGISTGLRKQFGGKFATQNLEGGFYDAGNVAGAVASFALGYGVEAQAARLSAGLVSGVRAYDFFGTTIGVVQGVQNLSNGTATGWDLLNFAPVAGFAAKNGRKIGGALMKAGDNGADAVWRGIDHVLDPQLVLAAERRTASATRVADDVDVVSHQFAAITGGGSSGATPTPSSITHPNGLPTNTFTSVDDLNRAANAPLVNRASQNFEYGGYTWTTDAQGRVAQVEGTLSIRPAKGRSGTDGVSTTVIGHHTDSNIGDVGFHLIGDQFDDPTNWLNVVPGNGVKQVSSSGSVLKSLNLSRYKTDFEHVVKNLAAIPGNVVEVKVKPIYNRRNSSLRPDKIETSYQVNGGSWTKTTFKNKAGG